LERLHLTQNVGASLALAGFGFAAFSTGMAASRFAGDRLRTRFGAVRLVLGSALTLAAGLAAALTIPHPVLAASPSHSPGSASAISRPCSSLAAAGPSLTRPGAASPR
jgi:hypothetical protein